MCLTYYVAQVEKEAQRSFIKVMCRARVAIQTGTPIGPCRIDTWRMKLIQQKAMRESSKNIPRRVNIKKAALQNRAA